MADKDLTTTQLVHHIRNSNDLDTLLQGQALPANAPTLKIHLMSLLRTRRMEPSELFERADIGKSMGYKLLSGKRKAGRDALLRIALALKLTIEETQRLLAIGEQGALYARTRRDAILIYAIERGIGLSETQTLLSEAKECDLWKTD